MLFVIVIHEALDWAVQTHRSCVALPQLIGSLC
jgi:hypothetical protein